MNSKSYSARSILIESSDISDITNAAVSLTGLKTDGSTGERVALELGRESCEHEDLDTDYQSILEIGRT